MKTERRIRIVMFMIVLAGSVMVGILPRVLNLSQTLKMGIYVGWFFIILLLAMNINLIWSAWIVKKMNKIGKILLEENDPDRYIEEMNKLLEGTKSAQFEQARLMNIGGAHAAKGDYAKAKEMYSQVKIEKLSSINQLIYWADMALTHFMLNEKKEACEIMERQEEKFGEYKENINLKNLLIILDIHWEIAKGNKEEAKNMIAKYRPEIENERNREDFEELERRVNL